MNEQTKTNESAPVDVLAAPVAYWVRAAREQTRLFVALRRQYRAEQHGLNRGRLWLAGNRCRDRRPIFMAEARKVRAALARVKGGAA
jgi:hypothetical protein